jgi:hypothetical protein
MLTGPVSDCETCRDCGATNPEGGPDPDDPAPGLCPDCFDRRVTRLGAAAEILFETMPREAFVRWLRDQLEHYAGMTPTAAEVFVRAGEGTSP